MERAPRIPLTEVVRSNKTVIVACKVPNGVILKVWRFEDDEEAVLGGGKRTFKRPVQDGPSYELKGPAAPVRGRPQAPVAGGYALNKGIPLEFWQKWLEQYKDSALVVNKMVFAAEKPDRIIAEARDNRDVRSNMEPLRPGTDTKGKNIDPRIPQAPSRNVSAVTTEAEIDANMLM